MPSAGLWESDFNLQERDIRESDKENEKKQRQHSPHNSKSNHTNHEAADTYYPLTATPSNAAQPSIT